MYAAQTGVSRFLEMPGVEYNKTENLKQFGEFDYLLQHEVEEVKEAFEVIGEELCFTGINWRRAQLRLEPCVYLLKKK